MTKHEYDALMQIVKSTEMQDTELGPNPVMPTHDEIYKENIRLGQRIVALRLSSVLSSMRITEEGWEPVRCEPPPYIQGVIKNWPGDDFKPNPSMSTVIRDPNPGVSDEEKARLIAGVNEILK